MGSVLDSKVMGDKQIAVVNPMPPVEETSPVVVEEERGPKSNVIFHLFHYRQQMSLKDQHIMKWATSKLQLTEELLKQQPEPPPIQPGRSLPDLDSDTAWAELELAMLTDDEDDDNENTPPMEPEQCAELNHLINYRIQLRSTILQVAQEKLRKREKTKLKRLQRRTLISSKKPSNKNKYRQ